VSPHAAARVFAQIATQSLHLCHDELRMVKERGTGGCRPHAATMPLQQSGSERLFHPFYACACRGKRNARTRGTSGNTALFDDSCEQTQVGHIKMHGTIPLVTILPMVQLKAGL
jgi:hypothetical protein